MKGKSKYILFYLMGLAEWAVIFCFLGLLHLSHRRLWIGYLLIALFSGIGSVVMYATRRIGDGVARLRYRVSIILVILLLIGACLWWAVVLAYGRPPASLDFAAVAATVMLAGACWGVYRMRLRHINQP